MAQCASESAFSLHESIHGVQPVSVAEQAKDKMIWMPRLDHDMPTLGSPPGSPGKLCNQGKGALCTPKVGHIEDVIDSQDGCGLHIWKVMPFGHQLGAHQDASRGLPKARQDFLVAPPSGGGIGVHSENRRRRKFLGQGFLDTLGSVPENFEGGATGLTVALKAAMQSTVMTCKATLLTVEDHSNSTGWTLKMGATARAFDDWGIASTVVQNNRLAAGRQGLVEEDASLRVKQFGRRQSPRVDEADLGQGSRGGPSGELEALISSKSGIGPALKAGGRGSQYHRTAFLISAKNRKISGVVAHAIVLLVGVIVFFIDHDQSQAGERRKQGRPSTNSDIRLTRPNAPPLTEPLGRAETGMEYSDPGPKPSGESLSELRR
jgi:hypothetical protein